MEPAQNGENGLLAAVGSEVRTAFDVGANVGHWAREVIRQCPNLVLLACYEPSSSAAPALRNVFARDPRVEVVESAVGDHVGTLTYYEQPDAAETSSLLSEWSVGSTAREVSVRSIDSELERLGIDRLDLLKSDAEGYDLHVLRGAAGALAAGRIRLIQFEYNRPWMHAGSTLQAARTFLESFGYRLYVLNERGLCACDLPRLGELFEYVNFVAITDQELHSMGLEIHADPIWG